MYFLTSIWISQVTGMALVAILEATVVHDHPSPIRALPGQTVNFTWTSNVKILEATWGIRNGIASADPQYIFVRANNENPVINPALDANVKSRIHYSGNLTAGRAWFNITNVVVSDSNTYIALIREDGSNTQPYYMQVIVETPTTAPSTTQPPTVTTTVPSTNYSGTSTSSTIAPSSSTTPSPTPGGKGAAIGGAVAGGVSGFLLIGGGVAGWFYYKKKQKSNQDNLQAAKKEETEMNA